MGAGPSTTELLFRIAAENAPLKEKLAESEAAIAQTSAAINSQTIAGANQTQQIINRTIAESLRQQGTSAEQAAQIYKQLGISGSRAVKEISLAYVGSAENASASGMVAQEFGSQVAAGAAAGAAGMNAELTPAMQRTANEIRQAHASAILLERQLGVQLPRGVTSMIAHSELLGSILTKVFAVTILVYFAKELDNIRQKIADAALAAGGFGEKARKSMEEAVAANEKALVSFKDVKTGVDFSAEINRNATALERQREDLVKSGGVVNEWFETLKKIFAPSITNQMATHKEGLRAIGEQMADNVKRGIQTGEQLAKVTAEQQKYNLEVLKARDAALAVGLKRSEQLKLELSELKKERGLELQTATGNADKIAKIEAEYGWKRVQLEKQITEATLDEQEKRNKPFLEALHRYGDVLGRLESQYDSGSTAVRRYLETSRQLAELEAKGIDTWMARKLNQQIFEKERTEAVTKATDEFIKSVEKVNPPMLAWLDSSLAQAAAELKLTDAERALLPLLGDHANALQRLFDNADAAVRNMKEEEMPARERINAQIDRQIAAAGREMVRYREQYTEKRITLAQFEAAEEQYTAVVLKLDEQRALSIDRETNYVKRAAVQQTQALRQIRQELENTRLSVENLELFGVEAFMNFGQAMGQSAAQALVYSKSVGAAMAAALKSTLASIADEAATRAIYATGLGFYYLAMHQYDRAADAFTAAAVWASIAGVAAVAGRAIPGGESTAVGRAAGSEAAAAPTVASAAAPLAAGAASAQGAPQNAPPPPPVTVYLTVQGDYLALPQAQEKLIGYINEAVTKRDVILNATHTKRPPPAGR